ncbi:hypothetical protein EX30DRAFT_340847 [Ascodesmis nigricans]|uniref:Translation machinery-associated protein 16 n=1 Tax=Ascodesmis nigricans TaxID=341454 RepID=A0A4V3SIR4_9PEZI|nr:hypothetical protein EX30DRAFT_340847 [Ascodesmis nigricans]
MPIALGKVQKHIRKKKGSLSALGDRDVKRVSRAALREKKLKHHATLRQHERENDYVRYGFMKVLVKDATEPLTIEQLREYISQWVHRNDPELERFESERRPGRPPTTKHLALKNRIEKELDEFRTGYKVPDLTTMENVKALQQWDGTEGSLAQITFIHVAKDPVPATVEADSKMEE